MVWGDGERLGADHTVTFKLGDGEPWQRCSKGQNGCLNIFSEGMRHMTATQSEHKIIYFSVCVYVDVCVGKTIKFFFAFCTVRLLLCLSAYSSLIIFYTKLIWQNVTLA